MTQFCVVSVRFDCWRRSCEHLWSTCFPLCHRRCYRKGFHGRARGVRQHTPGPCRHVLQRRACGTARVAPLADFHTDSV